MHIKQLRIVATLLIAFAIGQAGLGSGILDGSGVIRVAHATNAFAVVALTLVATVLGFFHRRAGGPAWVLFLPAGLLLTTLAQMYLGFTGVTSTHVFLGALFLSGVTAYCSYAFRLRPAPVSAGATR